MQLRPWIVLGTLLALIIWDVILISSEEILSVKLNVNKRNETDKLSGLQYTSAARADNLKAFGLSEEETSAVLTRIKKLETTQGERLQIILKDTEDQVGLQAALCGNSTEDIEPRYGAMRYFVRQDGTSRRPLRSNDLTEKLEQQDWSRSANIQGVYEALEFGAERQPDATLMGVAAILTRNEQTAIAREAPWGNLNSWSWSKVKTEYSSTGLEEDILNYFALMHLVVEFAKAEGGVCGA